MNRRSWTAFTIALLLVGCQTEQPLPEPPSAIESIVPQSPGAPPPDPVSGPPRLQRIGNFDQPIFVASPPGDGRLFVVERAGRVVLVEDGGAKEPAFLDISGSVSSSGERGLFSIAFAPDYSSSGLAYVSYTNQSGDSRVDEYRVDPSDGDRLDPDSRREILAVEQPFANHNGGLIAFEPSGMLLLGLGDGGSSGDPGNRAQDLGTLLGKFVRIDPGTPSDGNPYSIPSDNPFVGRSGARPEIWALGLRNPWRWSFDPENNDLFVGDVGQDAVEEINYLPADAQAGANYGWPRFEGSGNFKNVTIDESNLVVPVFEYPNGGAACSVTGGAVYRGSLESLRGVYLYGDYCEGVIKGLRVQDGEATDAQSFDDLEVPSLVSFGVDSAGEMYAVSGEGGVFKFVAG